MLCPGIWQVKEASKVYGVTTLEHPAVQMISLERGKYYLGGRVQVWCGVWV
jgi:sulfate adenylyltransferase